MNGLYRWYLEKLPSKYCCGSWVIGRYFAVDKTYARQHFKQSPTIL